MHTRYLDHQQGKEPIASVAYFCYTVLLASAGNHGDRLRHVARKLRISASVLEKIRRVASTKGDHKQERRQVFRTN